jgi:hypothetical protein
MGIAYFWYVQEMECQATPAGQQDQPAGQSHRDRWIHRFITQAICMDQAGAMAGTVGDQPDMRRL